MTPRLQAEKVIRGRRFRLDSPVVDAPLQHPTDSGLIADGIRRLTRAARQALRLGPETAEWIRDRSRAVKRRLLAIGNVLKQRTGEAGDRVRAITEELARLGEAQTHTVAGVVHARVAAGARDTVPKALARAHAQLTAAVDQLATVIAPSRAAPPGERIPDRIVSLADPDARPIKKGKLGHPVPFGYKVQTIEAEAGGVTDYTGEHGNPADVAALIPARDRHRAPFGRDRPQL